ncbi:MAG TPA: TIGR00296 family protein [Thermoplasmatales archaeon]|nr:TIGR00296 family protein [Thermoplasmatales archaeon]HEX17162.1 TIGR00296 family protein [Thermoplasmatales archaeon]
MLTLEEGKKAVKLARNTVDSYVKGIEIPDIELGNKFNEKSGAFVTILTFPARELRGCIGIPEPIYDLKTSIMESAKSATRDPRFPPLREEELQGVVIEVTILTPPKLIEVEDPRDYVNKIKIGRDGLIAEKGFYKGLLLPQVPVEWGWDVEEFLSQTCMKAGLPPDAWIDEDTKIYSFQGQIFCEKEPYGEVEERRIDREGN